MLKNHVRRDLKWLKRQARKDRRITVALLVAVVAAWVRQLPFDEAPGDLLRGLSYGLVAASGITWLAAAALAAKTVRLPEEPVAGLRWVSRIQRSKEWAFWSVGAYVAWHVLQFVTALVLG
ncbi:hypothetical protein ETD86_38675 [Nonomuraea turkmeniaca]|uniref:Uncharacterized protein n=1 Tax=Nonomuraea turkmeniaca TaxID=103838 RepID=A0A5S4F489_9ACTN|nr:hypothetical protein [Nonomuraea turkmeniaca]TMR10662.1 hypothetical protein ETD86_38675 [Nonomuraea turkmeniaca]